MTTHEIVPVPMGSRAHSSAGWTTFIVSFCWPLLVVAGATLWLMHRQDAMVASILETRPEVVVVDEIALTRLAIQAGANRYDANSVHRQIGQIMAANGRSDTLVIGSAGVLYAPDHIRAKTEAPVQ